MPDWDQVYLSKSVEQATPARVLVENQHLLPHTGHAMDYASGLGGNAIMLARRGLSVIAVDKSEIAVEKINSFAQAEALELSALTRDLEQNPVSDENMYDVIVVSYFLYRPALSMLYRNLKKDGLLFYETFSGPQLRGVGPSNPDFRLKRGELLSEFRHMELLYYREDPDLEDESILPGQVMFVAKK